MKFRSLGRVFTLFVSLLLLQACGNQVIDQKLLNKNLSDQSSLTDDSVSILSNNYEQVIFRSISDSRRRYFYRIPSLVTVNSNRYILAFAEERVANNTDSGDINVVVKVSYNDGDEWTRKIRVCELGGDTCGNPTAVVDQRNGHIHLFMMSNDGDREQFHKNPSMRFRERDRRIRYRKLWFSGRTLRMGPLYDLTDPHPKAPQGLYLSGMKMDLIGPGVGIQLRNNPHKNRLVIPSAHRVFISDDGGNSWRLGDNSLSRRSSESSIVELDNGTIFRNDRSSGVNKCLKDSEGNYLPGSPPCRRSLSWSQNKGESFTTPSISNRLYDPIAQGSMLYYSSGNIFFANCDSTVNRRNMTIRKTTTGNNWFSSNRIDASCGYSSMAKTRDYHLAIIYERKSSNWNLNPSQKPQDIVFKKFRLNEL